VKMKIKFTHHYAQRKTERADYIHSTNKYVETARSNPRIERILRQKGKWYCKQDPKDGIYRLYCIVNNLEVYCGIIINDEEVPYILITTYYPYSSKLKKRIFPRRAENYERFDVNDDMDCILATI